MPSSWDLYDPGLEPVSPATPALQAEPLLLIRLGRPQCSVSVAINPYKYLWMIPKYRWENEIEKANETFTERILTIKIPEVTKKPRIEITI